MDAMNLKDFDLLKEIKDRFAIAYDAVDAMYTYAIDDLNFLLGDTQWPTEIKNQRDLEGRPCLTINKLPVFADQIIGDLRQNEPAIKIKPVDSKADPITAEIFTGLIRNIEVQNDAEIAYDTAIESAIECGIGAFRIGTKYSEEDQFEQDITISRMKNPFTCFPDPSAEKWDKSDGRYFFITERIDRDEFKRMYPKASLMPFESAKDRNPVWGDDRNIRVAEYFKKEPVKKTISLVQKIDQMGMPGEMFVTEEKPNQAYLGSGWRVLKQREVEVDKIVWCKCTQAEIIEGPQDWPGKYFPIIMVYGKEINIEGETTYYGIVRHSKDPQRLYNYSRSTGAEVTSLAPKAPYLVTAKMISNYQNKWDTAHKKSYPYLPYDADQQAPGLMPKRVEPIAMNTGIHEEILIADQEMHDTTGLQLASLGKKSNEKSGRAIMARQREGDIANFAYYDNLARAMRYAGRVLIDLIPKIYDTPRIVRILNRDGTDKQVPINQSFIDVDGISKIFDLTVGKYDVVVSIGPGYNTQREETAEKLIEFLQAVPQAGPLVADLVAKNMDWEGSDELEKRLKLLLPPQLQDGNNGKPPPPNPQDIMAMEKFKVDMMKIQMETKKMEEESKGVAIENEEKFIRVQRMREGKTPEPKEKKDAPKERSE
jgi:hypothetical protein